MPRRRGCQQRFAIAWVEDEVMDDVTEKVRSVHPPGPSGSVALIEPRALARRDEDEHPPRRSDPWTTLCAPGYGLLPCCWSLGCPCHG